MFPLHPALLGGEGFQELSGKEELSQRRRHTDELLVSADRERIATLAVPLPLFDVKGRDGLSPRFAPVELVGAEFFLSRHSRASHLTNLQRQLKSLVRSADEADLGHFVRLRLRGQFEKAELDPAGPLHHMPALLAGLDRRPDLDPGRLGKYLVAAVTFEFGGHLFLLFTMVFLKISLYCRSVIHPASPLLPPVINNPPRAVLP